MLESMTGSDTGEDETPAGVEPARTPDIPRTNTLPPPRHPQSRGMRAWLRSIPFLTLIGYYLLLVLVVGALSSFFPRVREAFFMPVVMPAISSGDAIDMLQGGGVPVTLSNEMETLQQAAERSLTTFLVILGAMLLVVPVAWVYMQTKRLRYDPALVRSVVILPIVVAGITMVVKYSVALAFALAGIVAAVRFRNTLKDPRDAVYIFLVIGIGLASGVQEFDVALVMSLCFNFVMLTLWRYNIGSIYGGGYGQTGVMTTGDTGLLVGHIPDVRSQIRLRLLDQVKDFKTDGILLVHAEEVDLARHTVQEALDETAKDWRLVGIEQRDERMHTLQYMVDLKKDATPADLVGALDERWSAQVRAAEYFPFRIRESAREGDPAEKDDKDDDDDDD